MNENKNAKLSIEAQSSSLDWLITDARRQDLGEPSPQQKAMAELLGTDLISSTN